MEVRLVLYCHRSARSLKNKIWTIDKVSSSNGMDRDAYPKHPTWHLTVFKNWFCVRILSPLSLSLSPQNAIEEKAICSVSKGREKEKKNSVLRVLRQ